MKRNRKSTVGVVGICHGYPEKLNQWISSVKNLENKPDKVVLVLSEQINQNLFDFSGIQVHTWKGQYNFAEMFNYGISKCQTKWIAWIGIDDQYMSHALNKLAGADFDVLALGFKFDTGHVWIPSNVTKSEILSLRENQITCGSPFRKWLWHITKFDSSTNPVEDWGFWISTALNGAKYECSGTIDVLYEFIGHVNPEEKTVRKLVNDYLTTQAKKNGFLRKVKKIFYKSFF